MTRTKSHSFAWGPFRSGWHFPEHFHAEYGNLKALIDIKNASVLKGELPAKQLKLVLAWCEIHRDELMSNWSSARVHSQISKIDPLK